VADRLRRWSVQNENHGTDLKRLCEDCGELPSAAKAVLIFGSYGTAEAVPSQRTRVIRQTLKVGDYKEG
jgi:hypothetical protein